MFHFHCPTHSAAECSDSSCGFGNVFIQPIPFSLVSIGWYEGGEERTGYSSPGVMPGIKVMRRRGLSSFPYSVLDEGVKLDSCSHKSRPI